MTDFTYAEWQARAAALRLRDQLWIDGRFVPAADGRRFASINPANGATLAEVARGGAADIDRAVQAARRAFDDGRWSYTLRCEYSALLGIPAVETVGS